MKSIRQEQSKTSYINMHPSINEGTNDLANTLTSSVTNKINNTVRKSKGRRGRNNQTNKTSGKSHAEKAEKDNTLLDKRLSSGSLTDKRPFPFGLCRVCTDKATGVHYGVPTCEGCKGFFKRSILRKEKYRCYFGDICVINIENRNRCKSCRFQKCIAEGMSVEGVRMGRIPKLVKEKALADHRSSSSGLENDDPSPPLSSSSPPRVPPMTLNVALSGPVSAADLQLPSIMDDSSFFEDLDRMSANCQPQSPLYSCAAYVLPVNFTIDETNKSEDKRIVTLNQSALTHHMINCEEHFSDCVIERMMTIVPKISHPTEYTELDYEESSFIRYLRWKMFDLCNTFNGRTRQLIERMTSMITLGIKNFPGDHSALQDIWAGLTDAIPFHVKNLIAFAREMPAVNEIGADDFHKIMNNRLFDFWLIKHAPLICENESYMMLPNGFQYTRQWMVKIIGEEMVQTMFEFANKFNALHLTQEEHAIIFPVVICVKDKTLQDQETVRNIQSCYLYALYIQMLTTRTQAEAKEVFHKLLEIFGFLPVLNELQEKKVGALIPPDPESDL